MKPSDPIADAAAAFYEVCQKHFQLSIALEVFGVPPEFPQSFPEQPWEKVPAGQRKVFAGWAESLLDPVPDRKVLICEGGEDTKETMCFRIPRELSPKQAAKQIEALLKGYCRPADKRGRKIAGIGCRPSAALAAVTRHYRSPAKNPSQRTRDRQLVHALAMTLIQRASSQIVGS